MPSDDGLEAALEDRSPLGESVIITGGSSGIGLATARHALARGWRVLVTSRSEAGVEAARAEGFDATPLDLRDGASVARFVAFARDWCGGPLTGLVNNAGVALPGPLERLDMDAIREQFQVNVFGAVEVTQALLPRLRGGAGRVVFISSDRAPVAVPLYGAYVAAKRALEGFAESLALETEGQGVSVAILRLASFESNIRGPIRAHLEALDGDDPLYGEGIVGSREKLGSPPLHPPELAARAILDLLSSVAVPPLISNCPEGG